MGMNGQSKGREGFFGTGHEKWDPKKHFANIEEVEAAVASMVKKGIKEGELGADPNKKNVQERVLSDLQDADVTSLTPMDIANQIETSLENMGSGKTEFKRPSTLSRE